MRTRPTRTPVVALGLADGSDDDGEEGGEGANRATSPAAAATIQKKDRSRNSKTRRAQAAARPRKDGRGAALPIATAGCSAAFWTAVRRMRAVGTTGGDDEGHAMKGTGEPLATKDERAGPAAPAAGEWGGNVTSGWDSTSDGAGAAAWKSGCASTCTASAEEERDELAPSSC